MEVHHHGHVHEKKKWMEYLFQFLMLFLAVFLGFLAENQREHIVEGNRAREYAKSLLADLKNDTADISKAVFYDSMASSMIDSLVTFISDKGSNKKTGMLYYYIRLSGWIYIVDWNKATINQLINSGNLRYFSNTQLITKISLYNTLSSTIVSIQETIQSHRQRSFESRDHILMPQFASVFHELSMDDSYNGITSHYIDSLKNTDVPLQSNDPALLNSYANAILATKSNRSYLLKTLYPRAEKEALEIIELLREEYHLK